MSLVLKTEAKGVDKFRVEEAKNLQQKIQELERGFAIVIKEFHSWVVNAIEFYGDNGFFIKAHNHGN